MKVGRYHQGKFQPVYPEKYVGSKTEIFFRSDWERRMMTWCDLNPSVVKWNSEGLKIPYWSEADQKQRTYWIDFVVQYKTSEGNLKTIAVEIKPYAQTVAPSKRGKKQERYLAECYTYQVNQDKWKFAQQWANQNGMEFVIMTEFDLGIAKPKKNKGK